MTNEAQQHIWPLTQTGEPTVHVSTYLDDRFRRRVAQVLFDIPMHQLFRIQFRRVGRQPLDADLRLARQVLLYDLRPVRVEPVPDDDDWPTDLLPQVAQACNHIFAFDRVLEVPLVEFAAQRQANEDRQLTSPAYSPQYRRLASGCPGRCQPAQETEAGFVNEDDLRFASASLFLIRGQSRLSQSATKASSRS